MAFVAKPNLAAILANYLVAEDRMITWSPDGLGLLGSVSVTSTEGQLLNELQWNRGLLGLNTLKNIRYEAFDAADAAYPIPPGWTGTPNEWGNLGHNDAFRHTYWNARMAQEFGEDWAQRFATAHEGVPGNQPWREAQDLYNNELGRRIAREHPNATPAETANLVRQALEQGEAVVVDRDGNLQWSDDVPVGQHYVPSDTP